MEDREIYWLEDIGQEYNDIVGKKSANLGEALKVAGIQSPPGFALSIRACERFINETGIGLSPILAEDERVKKAYLAG